MWKNDQYQKFVLIAHGRSGSTFLRSLFNSHDEIKCYGELFNPVPKRTFFAPDYFPVTHNESPQTLNTLRHNEPLEFIDKYIWRKQAKKIKAIGFKLFYYHALEKPTNEIWDKILNDKSLVIFHLHRKNRLKTLASVTLAKKYDTWHSNIQDAESFKLSYEDCLSFFKEFDDFENKIDHQFKDHKFLKFSYEDLVSDQKNVLETCSSLLGVHKIQFKSRMKKLKKKTLSESILNYHELKSRFENTPWESFFTD